MAKYLHPSASELRLAKVSGAERLGHARADSAKFIAADQSILIKFVDGAELTVGCHHLVELRNASVDALIDIEVLGAGEAILFKNLDVSYEVARLIRTFGD